MDFIFIRDGAASSRRRLFPCALHMTPRLLTVQNGVLYLRVLHVWGGIVISELGRPVPTSLSADGPRYE